MSLADTVSNDETDDGRAPTRPRLAVLGAGEVGRLYAQCASATFDVSVLDPVAGTRVQDELASTGITFYRQPGEWLGPVDRVWSCVPGDLAISAIEGIVAHLGQQTVYVDMTTASPSDKRTAAQRAVRSGVHYVDVAIMGAVSLTRVATPLLIAGPDAQTVAAEFGALGAVTTVIDAGEVGDAVQLKLLRTVITKGLEALAVDAFTSASSRGLRDSLLSALGDIDQRGFTAFLNAVVATHPQHAERRMHEIDRAIVQLEADGVTSPALAGARDTFAATVQKGTQHGPGHR